MAAKFLVLFACLALSHSALVKRETSTPLEEIQKHGAEFQKTFSEQFSKLTSSKNTQEFGKALEDGSKSVIDQINSMGNALQNALKDATGKTKEALEQTKTNLEHTVEELRKAHPEVEQQASVLKDKLQAAVQNTVEETKKLAKEVSDNIGQTNEKLAPQIKNAYDAFVKQAEAVQKNLHEVANKQ